MSKRTAVYMNEDELKLMKWSLSLAGQMLKADADKEKAELLRLRIERELRSMNDLDIDWGKI